MTDARSLWPCLMDVPLSLRWLAADGVRTRCLEAGDPDAPAIVCLHGIGGHAEAYARNLGVLAHDHRVLAYDLPGHGFSALTDRSYEIAGYTAHLEALLDAAGIDSAVLLGASLGGWISLAFAAERPERVRGLILAGAAGTEANPQLMQKIRSLQANAVGAPSHDSIRTRLEWLMHDVAAIPDDLVETRRRIYAQPHMAEAMERTLCLQDSAIRARNLVTEDVRAGIECPALVVWGDDDATGQAEVGRRLAESLPRGSFVEFAACGHWPQFEKADQFNRECAQFLGTLAAAAHH